MPVVPITSAPSRASRPQRDPPDEPWALMAVAQMHTEGRLTAPESEESPRGQRTDRNA